MATTDRVSPNLVQARHYLNGKTCGEFLSISRPSYVDARPNIAFANNSAFKSVAPKSLPYLTPPDLSPSTPSSPLSPRSPCSSTSTPSSPRQGSGSGSDSSRVKRRHEKLPSCFTCYNARTRCARKDSGTLPCERCRRLGKKCVERPHLKKGRPRKHRPRPSPTLTTNLKNQNPQSPTNSRSSSPCSNKKRSNPNKRPRPSTNGENPVKPKLSRMTENLRIDPSAPVIRRMHLEESDCDVSKQHKKRHKMESYTTGFFDVTPTTHPFAFGNYTFSDHMPSQLVYCVSPSRQSSEEAAVFTSTLKPPSPHGKPNSAVVGKVAVKREKPKLDGKYFLRWNEEEVMEWLNSFKFGEQYLSAFSESSIIGVMLPELTREILESEIKMKKLHALRLVQEIRRLVTQAITQPAEVFGR